MLHTNVWLYLFHMSFKQHDKAKKAAPSPPVGQMLRRQ